MNIQLFPTVSNDHNEAIRYDIQGDVVKAVYKLNDVEMVETYDFTGLPDGILNTDLLVSKFPVPVLQKAIKEQGELTLELLYFIGQNAPESERFPEMFEAKQTFSIPYAESLREPPNDFEPQPHEKANEESQTAPEINPDEPEEIGVMGYIGERLEDLPEEIQQEIEEEEKIDEDSGDLDEQDRDK